MDWDQFLSLRGRTWNKTHQIRILSSTPLPEPLRWPPHTHTWSCSCLFLRWQVSLLFFPSSTFHPHISEKAEKKFPIFFFPFLIFRRVIMILDRWVKSLHCVLFRLETSTARFSGLDCRCVAASDRVLQQLSCEEGYLSTVTCNLRICPNPSPWCWCQEGV